MSGNKVTFGCTDPIGWTQSCAGSFLLHFLLEDATVFLATAGENQSQKSNKSFDRRRKETHGVAIQRSWQDFFSPFQTLPVENNDDPERPLIIAYRSHCFLIHGLIE